MLSKRKWPHQCIIAAIFFCALIGIFYVLSAHDTTLLYPSRGPYTPAHNCPEILLQLDDAISLWAYDNHKGSLDAPNPAVLDIYFTNGHTPKCPTGGEITLGTKALATICSIHGHAVDNRPPPPQRRLTLKERLFPQIYLGSQSACIVKLKQIDRAFQEWALENGKMDWDTLPAPQHIAIYLNGGELPSCPAGGKYILANVVSNAPACTRGTSLGHSLP